MNNEAVRFRTSTFGGFNRQDVIGFIQSFAKEKGEAIASLQATIDAQQKELEAFRAAAPAEVMLCGEDEPLTDEVLAVEALPDEAAPETKDYTSMELEAYRRAEALERAVTERSKLLGEKLDELCVRLKERFDYTGSEIESRVSNISQELGSIELLLDSLPSIIAELRGDLK